jgi:hypothetical protein
VESNGGTKFTLSNCESHVGKVDVAMSARDALLRLVLHLWKPTAEEKFKDIVKSANILTIRSSPLTYRLAKL